MTRPLGILQVSTADRGGGAEQVALNLHQGFLGRGHDSWLAVGVQRTSERGVMVVDNDSRRGKGADVTRWANRLAMEVPPLPGRAIRALGWLGQPSRFLDRLLGHEDFDMPATAHILDLARRAPDVVHCHNLHGSYFDLRELPRLSRRLPVFLTLHDMWTLTGHCAYSLGCGRWRHGCGRCPDLSIYPPVKTDGTSFNWARKRDIYRKSRFRVASPSRWLLDLASKSVLSLGMVEGRVIPYGVDLATFNAQGRTEARRRLGIAREAKVLLFAANGGRANPFKDYATVEKAVSRVTDLLGGDGLTMLVVGGTDRPTRVGGSFFVPYLKDRAALADYYRAADLFLHAAHEDNFPNTILESLACGTPVVATAVGGVPEQIDDGLNGALVPAGNPQAMAQVVIRLLRDDEARSSMSLRAAEEARLRFSLERQVGDYLRWFEDVVAEECKG